MDEIENLQKKLKEKIQEAKELEINENTLRGIFVKVKQEFLLKWSSIILNFDDQFKEKIKDEDFEKLYIKLLEKEKFINNELKKLMEISEPYQSILYQLIDQFDLSKLKEEE